MQLLVYEGLERCCWSSCQGAPMLVRQRSSHTRVLSFWRAVVEVPFQTCVRCAGRCQCDLACHGALFLLLGGCCNHAPFCVRVVFLWHILRRLLWSSRCAGQRVVSQVSRRHREAFLLRRRRARWLVGAFSSARRPPAHLLACPLVRFFAPCLLSPSLGHLCASGVAPVACSIPYGLYSQVFGMRC